MRQRCRNLTGGPGFLKTLCVRSGKSRQQCRCLAGGIREDATALSQLNGGPRGFENAMRSLRGAGKRCLLQRKGERKLNCLSSVHILLFSPNSDRGARGSFPEMMQVKKHTKTIHKSCRGEAHAYALQVPKHTFTIRIPKCCFCTNTQKNTCFARPYVIQVSSRLAHRGSTYVNIELI